MPISPARWQPLLSTRHLGRPAPHVAHTLTSTNTVLRELGRQGAPHGTVCLCECQTGGKGRLGRTWASPEGKGVWISVLLRPQLKMEDAPLITLITAMAMAQAIRESCGVAAQVKWPNALVYAGRKVCGVLAELGFDADGGYHVITGAGLNVHEGAYPPELAHRAAALAEFAPAPDRSEVIARYLQALETLLDTLEGEGFPGIESAYRALSCTLGSQVHVLGAAEDFTGVAEAVDATGALLVRTGDGELRRVLAGDVSVRGVMGYV